MPVDANDYYEGRMQREMSEREARAGAKMIYVASSWRNPDQPKVVELLRLNGHEVYDFRNPRPGDNGFRWSDIDPAWKSWTPETYRDALSHPIAEAGFRSDFEAMQECAACVLVLPCGRSAHAEAGWFAGAGRPVHVLMYGENEPELMYKLFTRVHVSAKTLIEDLAVLR